MSNETPNKSFIDFANYIKSRYFHEMDIKEMVHLFLSAVEETNPKDRETSLDWMCCSVAYILLTDAPPEEVHPSCRGARPIYACAQLLSLLASMQRFEVDIDMLQDETLLVNHTEVRHVLSLLKEIS